MSCLNLAVLKGIEVWRGGGGVARFVIKLDSQTILEARVENISSWNLISKGLAVFYYGTKEAGLMNDRMVGLEIDIFN